MKIITELQSYIGIKYTLNKMSEKKRTSEELEDIIDQFRKESRSRSVEESGLTKETSNLLRKILMRHLPTKFMKSIHRKNTFAIHDDTSTSSSGNASKKNEEQRKTLNFLKQDCYI